jgi:hypothetical protein
MWPRRSDTGSPAATSSVCVGVVESCSRIFGSSSSPHARVPDDGAGGGTALRSKAHPASAGGHDEWVSGRRLPGVCVCSVSPLGHSIAPVFLQARSPGRFMRGSQRLS